MNILLSLYVNSVQVDISIILILQMENLRHGEMNELA